MIVFFDIDGTIWNRKMEIRPSVYEAMKLLKQNGHYAFINSGRSRSALNSEKLLSLGFDGIVAGCGTYVEMHGETVYERLIDEKTTESIIDLSDECGILCLLEGRYRMYCDIDRYAKDWYIDYLIKTFGDVISPIPERGQELNVNKFSCNIGYAPDEKTKEYYKSVIENKYGYRIIDHGGEIVEIIPHDTSKATGIDKVCEIMNIPLSETIAVGDGNNDLDMIKHAGIGMVMGNATDDVKAHGDTVTSGVDEDGVFMGLKRLGVI